jgi:hypothetical protein
MEIGIGDADVPGDEAMGADLDSFLRHDERAVHERKIADGAGAVHPDGERAAGITGNVIAEDDGPGCFTLEVAKYLSALAIKTVAEDYVGRDRVLPPILFDSPLAVDVAHVG